MVIFTIYSAPQNPKSNSTFITRIYVFETTKGSTSKNNIYIYVSSMVINVTQPPVSNNYDRHRSPKQGWY